MVTTVQAYSPRITGEELPRNGKPILITSYTVQDKGNGNYQAVLQGERPFEVDWPRQNGTITPEMLGLLVPQDAVTPLNAGNTYVWTDSNPNYSEGLRRLHWVFRVRERPLLDSDWVPEGRDSYRGALLGSVAEDGNRLKIGGVDYLVQPEVALRGKNLWEISLYAQGNGMLHLLSPQVNTIAKFTQPENPDNQWVRSEVERFERNGSGLKEKQVKGSYRELRDGIWKSYAVIAKGILAWPIASEERPSEDTITVPRSEYQRLMADSETLARVRKALA